MFSIKGAMALGCAALLASGAVQAQVKAPAGKGHVASARLPAADIGLIASAPAASNAITPASQPSASPTNSSPAQQRLSIDDIDEIARKKIARQLAGDGGFPTGAGTMNSPAPASAPYQAPAIKVATPRQRAESVQFVGAFSDVTGPSVLYEFRGASYPAHVGARLLNGWMVKRVDGFVVTVSDGAGKKARTWTETISAGTHPVSEGSQPGMPMVRVLNDLSGPLPPSIPLSAIGQ